MTLELTILIWLAAILYASGCLDNLAAKGIAALFRIPPKRSAARSRMNSGSAVRSVPSRSGGNFFRRFVQTFTDRERPVRATKVSDRTGSTFDNPNYLEWEWPR